MEKEPLDINEVTMKFKILGLPITATKEQVRYARNKLLHHFHPDKHHGGWILDSTDPEKRVYLIQSAYLYITENYNEIHETFRFLSEEALTNRIPVNARSHWTYMTVSTFDHDHQ